ncbi:MAG: transposase [Anaerolineaceae bacterium]|nr:transposase [Anaerolineaceae bacterium]
MPKPIVCLSTALSQFAELFRPCFSPRQWKYFVIVLLGLIECDGRRTLRGLLGVVGEQVSLCGLSRFFSRWQWSERAVAQVWLDHFRVQMKPQVQADHQRQRTERVKRRGRPQATVVTGYLIVDDSVNLKVKGRKMKGLGRHYSTTAGQVVTGHCLFSGLYVLLERRCPLQPRLYRQKAVCEQEEVPFVSKIELAVQEIEQFEPVEGAHTHVLMDSWFHCRKVRRAAQKRGWDVSGGLKRNRVMRQINSDGSRTWLKLAAYAAGLTAEDWQLAHWPSQEGNRPVYVHTVSTWIRKLGPTQLLITCHNPDNPAKSIRYWGSTLLAAEAQTVINTLAVRWSIEVLFEDNKDLLGADHYQLMSAQALVRFWTLMACLGYFLDEQKALRSDCATWGDVRRSLQKEHQTNLLFWLEAHFKAGLSVHQIGSQLAIFSS